MRRFRLPRAWFGMALFMMLVLAACGTDPAVQVGQLEVEINGLPEGLAADVSVTGPGDFSEHLTGSGTFEAAAVGAYQITAAGVADAGTSYEADEASIEVTVQAGETTTANVNYSVVTGPTPEPDLAGLVVEITGQGHLDADVTVTGPADFSEDLSDVGTSEFMNIEPGAYSVEATAVADGAELYEPSVSPASPVTIEAEEVTTVTVHYERSLGSLEVIIVGLGSVPADVTVTGPEDFDERLTTGETLTDLPPGEYSVQATGVLDGADYYEASVGADVITLAAGEETDVTVTYTPASGTVSYVRNNSGDASEAGSLGYRLAESADPASNVERIYFDADFFTGPTNIELDGEITIGHDIRIVGLTNAGGEPLITLRAAADSRIMSIEEDTEVEIRNLAFRDGDISGATGSSGRGGAIRSEGQLELHNVVISENSAHEGGGIRAFSGTSSLLISDSIVSNNKSNRNGGGIMSSADLTIHKSTIAANEAGVRGGGIYANSSGQIDVSDSTISGNRADDDGGGMYARVETAIINSTIANNAASSGGGLDIGGQDFVISYSTITGNSSDSTSAVSGGGIRILGGGLELRGTVIAGNSGSRDLSRALTTPDIISSLGYNVIGTWYAPDDEPFLGSDELIDTDDPFLAPLDDNGGPTETVALLEGSPALNLIPVSECSDANGDPVEWDQRGVSRPQGSHCDAGAYEASRP